MSMIDRLKQKIQQLEGVPSSLLGIAGVTRTPPPQVQRAAPVQHATPEPIVRQTVQAPSPQRETFEPVQHATPRDLEQSTYNPQGPRSARQVVQAPKVQRQGFEPFQRVQHATPPPIERQVVQHATPRSPGSGRPANYLPEPQFQQPAPRVFNPAGNGGVYNGIDAPAGPSPTAEVGGERVRIARPGASQAETEMPNPVGLERQRAQTAAAADEAAAQQATRSALPGGRLRTLTKMLPLALGIGGAVYAKLRGEPPQQAAAAPGSNNYGNRADGTPKGDGYFGPIKRPDGRVMTEVGVGTNINGKETQIPAIVPTLNQDELDYLSNAPVERRDLWDSAVGQNIMKKAGAHASERVAQGKSPFAEPAESGLTPAYDRRDMPGVILNPNQYLIEREKFRQSGIAAPAKAKAPAKAQGGGQGAKQGGKRSRAELPGLQFTPQEFNPETDAGALMAKYTDPQAGVREGLANPAVAEAEDSAANVAEQERIASLEAQQIPSFQMFRGERGEISFAAPNADGTMPEVVIPGKMRTPAGISYKTFEDKAYPEIEDRRLKREGIAAQTRKYNAEADAEPIKANAEMKRAQADADSVGAKYITARGYAKMAENGGEGGSGTKGFKERVKMHFNRIKDRDLPDQFTGQHSRLAEILALADTPDSDVGIYYNPGTPGRGGIATRRSTFDAKVNKYRQAGYPEKDAIAHAFGELQPGEYEPFPNLDRLPDRAKKKEAASIEDLLGE